MNRELRYYVAKVKDVEKYLSDEKQLKLDQLLTSIRIGRLEDGKEDVTCVCVESDWPEYETAWRLIEARVDGKPNEIDQLRAENTTLKAENERLKKRCFPSKVLMIGDAGHYVSEAVFVEMERLKAELAEAKKDAELWREREAKIKSLKERGFLKSPLRDDPYKVVMKGK